MQICYLKQWLLVYTEKLAPLAKHHLRFGSSTAGHFLSLVYMIINVLSAGKRHYEKYVNVCEDGSNKLLITISESVSVRFRTKY